MTPPRPLDPRRVGLGALLFAAAVATLAGAGVLLPRDAGGESGAFIAGLVLSPLVLSLWEWSTHRYLYHRALRPWLRPVYETHHRDHHILAFPPWRFSVDDRDAAPGPSTMYRRVLRERIGLDLPISDRGVYLAFCILTIGTPVWLLTRRPAFLAGLLLSGLAVFQLFDAVHDAMHHRGRHAWIERQRWFAFLRRHHFVHHVDTEANLNFLLPLADVLFGTFRPAASPEEMSRVRSRGTGVSGPSPSRARTSP